MTTRDTYEMPDALDARCPHCHATVDAIWVDEVTRFVRACMARDFKVEAIKAQANALLAPRFEVPVDRVVLDLVVEAVYRREWMATTVTR